MAINGMNEIMTPAEFILTRGYCMYCKTDIDDNDRCGCDKETIWYLTQAVEVLEKALQPLANVYPRYTGKYPGYTLDQIFFWHESSKNIWINESGKYLSVGDAKRAHEALEKVELML